MKKVIGITSESDQNFVMEWNTWVPKKVNIFMWKDEIGIIATLKALERRNINVGSLVCRICEDGDKSSEHLLTSCYFATVIWNLVSNWCEVRPIYPFSIRDLTDAHKYMNVDTGKRKVIQGIIYTTCWVIWKTRNNQIFNNKIEPISKTMESIKALGFLWINNRLSYKTLS
ncbi:putative reverse transcriptase zinc-binding domain-containing protein [Helianthus annuus]|uniref:Reverse transcriptase zinc-binding domain-containing protein n=1 Tax=Helianthus annuus TaxID=4232 RepID=A0A9K3NE39_HELAN|nr:putative reverse transcriptase zinc-binding domain-containing protein [Helianthus annuus]KAJ0903067.1 putative reverse transcriptase zinc-binding domain-containing protein [Helianthus annuus]